MEPDVVIVGAGPAGSAAALCLARLRLRPLLIDSTHLENERFGVTLPPEVTPLLRRLGVWEAYSGVPRIESPGVVSVWDSPAEVETDFIRNPHGCGWHVDRNAFDRMLCDCVLDAGARVWLGCALRSCEPVDAGGWHLKLTADGKDFDVDCGGLIDASGRNGLGNATGVNRRVEDLLLAIVLEIDTQDRVEDCRVYLEAAPDGWWYSSPSTARSVTAMFFTSPEIYASQGILMGEQLKHCPLTSRRIGAGRILRQTLVNAPSALASRIAGPGFLAAGDSAAVYDPISGRGVFKALRDGMAAAEALSSGAKQSLSGEYAATVEREFLAYSAERKGLYNAVGRWRERPFWSKRR